MIPSSSLLLNMQHVTLTGSIRTWWLTAGLLTGLSFIGPAVSAQQRLIDSLKVKLVRPMLSDTMRFNTSYDIANAFYKQGHSDSAEVYLKPARQISQRMHYRQGTGDCNRLLAIIRMHQGRYEEALTYYQTALTDYTKANKLKGVAMVHNSMGWLFKMMGESQHVLSLTRQGMEHEQQAIAINQQMNNLSLLVDNYVNLGIIYEDMAEYDPRGNTENYQLGRACFLKAIAICDQLHAPPAEYRVMYNNLGKNYHMTGQYRLAVDYLQKSLAINLPLKKLSSLAHNYRNLASAYRG